MIDDDEDGDTEDGRELQHNADDSLEIASLHDDTDNDVCDIMSVVLIILFK